MHGRVVLFAFTLASLFSSLAADVKSPYVALKRRSHCPSPKSKKCETKPVYEELPCENLQTSAPLKDVCPQIVCKFGYFWFEESILRDVYNEGGFDFQCSFTFPLYRWLQLYSSIEYLERSGRSLGALQKTNIWEVPLSLGIRPVVRILDELHWYFSIGPRYTFVHVHNDSAFVDRNLNESGFGTFINSGFNIFPIEGLVIDLFGEYSYTKLHFHPKRANVFGRSIQMGGVAFGAGLGYAF